MAMTSEQWRDGLLALLPEGRAWSKEPGSNFYNVAWALAERFAAVEQRIDDMLIEADPRFTVELLDEWEQRYGLPRCGDLELSDTQRRDVLVATITAEGNGTPQNLIDIAADIGYVITIDENTPDVGTFTVNAPLDNIAPARYGIARYGERYQTWGNELLQCMLNFYKHAHLQYNIAFS